MQPYIARLTGTGLSPRTVISEQLVLQGTFGLGQRSLRYNPERNQIVMVKENMYGARDAMSKLRKRHLSSILRTVGRRQPAVSRLAVEL